MKKLLVLLLMLAMVMPQALAEEEMKPLSLEEMNQWTESLVGRAMNDKLEVKETENGFAWEGRGYSLTAGSKDLSADTTLTSAVIDDESIEVQGLTGPRNLIVTVAAGAVLDAFPNDNADLKGSKDMAVLYLRGTLPGQVMTGVVYRSGQDISLIEYSVYAVNGDSVDRSGILFTVEKGTVTAIRYFGGEQVPTVEAEQQLNTLAALQETGDYFAYSTVAPTPMQREDLVLGGLDFLDMTPESAEALLGKPAAEEKLDDSNGQTLVTKQWADIFITFSYKDGVFLRTESAVVHGALQGPRGVTVGETMLMVLGRFENKAESLNRESTELYGSKENTREPYGQLYQQGDAQTLYYSVPLSDGAVLFTATFMGETLVEMSLQRQ